MIAHVVLFRPRPDLTPDQRHDLAAALSTAIREIPSIRSARVGRRVLHGRGYEQRMSVDYSYAAILEFDDVAGLKTYLAHPAHVQLADRFFAGFEQALMYDYELNDGEPDLERLLGEA
jgi:hypothetical protein